MTKDGDNPISEAELIHQAHPFHTGLDGEVSFGLERQTAFGLMQEFQQLFESVRPFREARKSLMKWHRERYDAGRQFISKIIRGASKLPSSYWADGYFDARPEVSTGPSYLSSGPLFEKADNLIVFQSDDGSKGYQVNFARRGNNYHIFIFRHSKPSIDEVEIDVNENAALITQKHGIYADGKFIPVGDVPSKTSSEALEGTQTLLATLKGELQPRGRTRRII